VLDAALALEQHIDVNQRVRRIRYPEYVARKAEPHDEFRRRFAALDPEPARDSGTREPGGREPQRAPLPPHPERDLLWFIANYAPELEGWERDIFLAVREESFYFYPVFATQIMNEGWASYWHARLLREADFLPSEAYVDAIKCHSDVVRPLASGEQVALSVNPYHVGFSLWEKLVERDGLEGARRIMREDDDFSFIRNHLTSELATELKLFRFGAGKEGATTVLDADLPKLHDALLAPKYNFGAPTVAAAHVRVDGTLELLHDHRTDGRGLDPERATRVLEYVHRVWRRPVKLTTVKSDGEAIELGVP
jgi:stage V sporulation protein R